MAEFDPKNPPPEVKRRLEELETKEKQRQQQQGYGRPIISTEYMGYRCVAVGSKLHCSKSWRTFHDFLMYYLKHVLGGSWGTTELKKPFGDRHPLLQWYELVCREQKKTIKTPGRVYDAPMTGAILAYLKLAYNLYLIDHNCPGCPVRDRLLARLRDSKQFQPAVYETYVVAAFIKAGFDIDFEDESDSTTSHCEFVATCKATGSSYSVEAKARQPGKTHYGIGNQLSSALKKTAAHTRVVFIDINVPEGIDDSRNVSWLENALQELQAQEGKLTVLGSTAPSAYVFVTNHPYPYNLKGTMLNISVLAQGFKIPDFKLDSTFADLRSALNAREKHSDMLRLMDSIRDHYVIPATFDGEIAEFAYHPQTVPRLLVGKKYLVPDKDGQEQVSELVNAVVLENDKTVWGLYRLEDGRQLHVSAEMTDQEIAAYRQHPDTFFGVDKPRKNASTPLDLYDFFYNAYRKIPKDRLLFFMNQHPDIADLKNLPQSELAKTYCARLTYAALKDRSSKGPSSVPGESDP